MKKSKIKKSLYLLAACAILLPIAGCQKKRGGGFLSILTATDPKTAKTAAYGICADKKLGFIIFSETTGDGSASSSWIGQIKPKDGIAIDYQGSSDQLTINGTEYKFTGERVFLVATKVDTLSVQQPNIPVSDAAYDEEINRIKELENVRIFLSQ